MRIGSNARIPGDSHYKNKKYCSCFSKKIEMVKIAIPNFCINFLNKTAKSLSILCDFAVAPLTGAWIKICIIQCDCTCEESHPSRVRGLKFPGFSPEKTGIESHPSRVRGLKWTHLTSGLDKKKSRTLYGAWIKTI